jgi:hypothetical protein
MAQPSEGELQEMARALFGREIEADKARSFRARLPAMARVKALLQDREGRLGETEPVSVYRVPSPAEDDRER